MRTRSPAALALVGALFRPAPSPAQQPTMEGYPAAGEPPTITVLDLGAEPRLLLRLQVSPGQREAFLVTMDSSVIAKRGSTSERTDMPTVKMTGEVTVIGVSPDGDVSYAVRMANMTAEPTANVDPGALAATWGALASLPVVTFTAIASDRGILREMHFPVEDVTDPQRQQQRSELSASYITATVSWPEEAVGVGARWLVRQATTRKGVVAFTATEYEILSIQGPSVTLSAKTEGTAPSQSPQGADTPAGVDAQLSLSVSGSARTTARLDSMVWAGESHASVTTVLNLSSQAESLMFELDERTTFVPTTLQSAASDTVVPPPQPRAMDGYPAPGAPAVLTLVDPGREPRVPLRLRPFRGQHVAMVMKYQATGSMQLGAGQRRGGVLPTLRMTADVAVTGVSADGDISLSVRGTGLSADGGPEVARAVLAAFRKSAALFQGATLTATVSARGAVRDTRVDFDTTPDAEMAEMVSTVLTSYTDAVVPLPEEPVGVGARWIKRETDALRGAIAHASAEYELLSMVGPVLTLAVRLDGRLPQQLFEAGPGQPGGEVRFSPLSGVSKNTVRLDSMVLRGEGRTAISMFASQPGQQETTTIVSEMRSSVAPARPDEDGLSITGPDELPQPRLDTALTGWDPSTVVRDRLRVAAGVLSLTGDSGWLLTSASCGEFSVEFEARALTPDTVAGMLVHVQPASPPSAYEVRLCRGGNCGELLRHEGGETRRVRLPVTIGPRENWCRYAIAVKGRGISAVVDDEPVLREGALAYDDGRLGFGVSQGAIEIRNFALRCGGTEPAASASAPPTTSGTRTPGGTIVPPLKTAHVEPVYPAEASRAGLYGAVVIQAAIDAEGRVARADVLSGAGPLRQEALRAVRQWRYAPTFVNGKAVTVDVTVTVNFTLPRQMHFKLKDLLAGLRHEDEEIREAAARTLGYIKPVSLRRDELDSAMKALQKATKDKSERVRNAAADALARIRPQ